MIFLIIGGPGFGKSTVAKELERRSHTVFYDPCTPEFFKSCIGELGSRDTNNLELNKRILQKRVAQFESAPEELCFSDRGIPDCLAYMHNPPEEFLKIIKAHQYQKIAFVTPPWKEIHEQHFGRLESFDEACKVHARLVKVYEDLGYTLIELPKVSVQERADFILAKSKAF